MIEERIVLTDEPLKSLDQDKLGFAPLAERVASVIKNIQGKESVVFAVCGKWGSGKTTFLNFLTSYLNNDNSITIVKFNPWWFSGKEDLILQFLHNMKFILDRFAKFKEIAKAIKSYVEALEEVPNLGWISKIVKILQKSIAEAKERIIRRLKNIDGKIVVIIDDIDRLTAEEIREIFTIVKTIADFPKTVYILAFDKEVVTKALEKVQEGKGENYLEKIVQVPIELPFADKIALRKMLYEELNMVLFETPRELFDETYWWNIYFNGIDMFINTVRDIKRLLNAIKITYTNIKSEVNAVDFIPIESLRIFCPKVHQIIKNNPDMFCGSNHDFLYSSEDSELKQFHQKWLSDLDAPNNIKENIKNLLKRMFPKLESVFGNNHYGPDREQLWRRECRICSKKFFPRFFYYSVPSDDLSRAEMKIILNSLSNEEKFYQYLKYLITQKRSDGSTKLSVFLERMEDYISEISHSEIPIVIETFFTIGDELIIPEDETISLFISWKNDIRMKRTIWQLLYRYDDKNKRFEILKNAFEKGEAVSMMVNGLISLWQQHGKYGAPKNLMKACY